MKEHLKPVPKFRSTAAERKFWETHDTTQYLDWSLAALASFRNLNPDKKSMSLRRPLDLVGRVKI